MKYLIKNIYNRLDFFLRKHIKFTRKGYCVVNEDKSAFLNGLSQEALDFEKKAVEKFNLVELKNNSTIRNYAENLYIIELLEKYFVFDCSKTAQVLDIGSKDWFYAVGEYSFFKYYIENLIMNGIEIDAYRVYSNFYSRYDAARYNTKNLKGANYIVGDFLKHNQKYDYITWFFPFLTPFPLLKWGLPMHCLKPQEMFDKAYNSLNLEGKMLIMNQGQKEYELQKELLIEKQVCFEDLGEFNSEFVEYESKRFVFKIKKKDSKF